MSTPETIKAEEQHFDLDDLKARSDGALRSIESVFRFTLDGDGEVLSGGGENGDENPVFRVTSSQVKDVPIEILSGEKLKNTHAQAYICFGTEIKEPEHWKWALLRKHYVAASYEPTSEIEDFGIWLVGNTEAGDQVTLSGGSWHKDGPAPDQSEDIMDLEATLRAIQT